MSDGIDLSELLAVQQKIEAKVTAVSARRADDLVCAKGCHQCCADGLTVLPIEAAALIGHVAAEGITVRVGPEEDGCAFLDEAGACQVYAGRPLLCRTHGLPMRMAEATARQGLRVLDDAFVCGLNFTERDPEPDDVIDATLVQALLTTVNARAGLGDGRMGLRELAESLAG